jgi:hypothetical protein
MSFRLRKTGPIHSLRGAFDTYILLANANASPAIVTATYLLDDGTTSRVLTGCRR